MIVGAAGDDAEAACGHGLGQGLGVGEHLLLVGLEIVGQGFLERNGLGRDAVLERAALGAGEDHPVEVLGVLLLAHHDGATRAAQGLVGGGRHDIGVGDR